MSKSIYARFKTNKALEDEGTWIDYGDGLKFKIRRFSAKKSLDVRNDLEAPFKARGSNGEIPPEAAERIAIEHLARGILVDWDGLFDMNGNAVAFSVEAAKQTLTDLPDLAKYLIVDSINADNFKDKEKKETAGN